MIFFHISRLSSYLLCLMGVLTVLIKTTTLNIIYIFTSGSAQVSYSAMIFLDLKTVFIPAVFNGKVNSFDKKNHWISYTSLLQALIRSAILLWFFLYLNAVFIPAVINGSVNRFDKKNTEYHIQVSYSAMTFFLDLKTVFIPAEFNVNHDAFTSTMW